MSDTFDRREYDGAMRFQTHAPRSGKPRGRPMPKAQIGEGPCPKCGAPTRLVPGGPTYNPFHGCTKFPACRGSRLATVEEIEAYEDNQAFYAEHGMTAPTSPDSEATDSEPQRPYGKYPYGIKHHHDSLTEKA